MRRLAWGGTIAALAGLWLLAARALWGTTVPADLSLPELDVLDYFTAAEIDLAERFERVLLMLTVFSTFAVLVSLGALAALGRHLGRRIGLGRIATGILLGVLSLTVVWMIVLPFEVASEWWQRRHGLSRASYADTLTASWVGLLIEVTAAALIIAAGMGLAARLRRYWWVVAAPALTALTIGLVFAQPYLFVDAETLRRPALVRDARSLARSIGVEGTPVKVDEVHKDTTQANALALGLGSTSRIILWDTLLDGRFRPGEIRVVIAHEFGHIARKHLWKGVAWSALFTVPILLLVAELTRLRGGLADPAAIPLLLLLLVAVQLVVAPLYNVISRRYEQEADWTALQATRDPASATELFRRFATTSLGDPNPPAWAHILLGTHPTTIERIEMAESFAERR